MNEIQLIEKNKKDISSIYYSKVFDEWCVCVRGKEYGFYSTTLLGVLKIADDFLDSTEIKI